MFTFMIILLLIIRVPRGETSCTNAQDDRNVTIYPRIVRTTVSISRAQSNTQMSIKCVVPISMKLDVSEIFIQEKKHAQFMDIARYWYTSRIARDFCRELNAVKVRQVSCYSNFTHFGLEIGDDQQSDEYRCFATDYDRRCLGSDSLKIQRNSNASTTIRHDNSRIIAVTTTSSATFATHSSAKPSVPTTTIKTPLEEVDTVPIIRFNMKPGSGIVTHGQMFNMTCVVPVHDEYRITSIELLYKSFRFARVVRKENGRKRCMADSPYITMECPYPQIQGITRNYFGLHLSDNSSITSKTQAGVLTCKVTYKVLQTHVSVLKVLRLSYVETTNSSTSVTLSTFVKTVVPDVSTVATKTLKRTTTRIRKTTNSLTHTTSDTTTPRNQSPLLIYMTFISICIMAAFAGIMYIIIRVGIDP